MVIFCVWDIRCFINMTYIGRNRMWLNFLFKSCFVFKHQVSEWVFKMQASKRWNGGAFANVPLSLVLPVLLYIDICSRDTVMRKFILIPKVFHFWAYESVLTQYGLRKSRIRSFVHRAWSMFSSLDFLEKLFYN